MIESGVTASNYFLALNIEKQEHVFGSCVRYTAEVKKHLFQKVILSYVL